jgi:acetyl-CoA synthase
VLALGEIDDLKYAAAAGAINYGFPVVADTVIPQILPTGVTQHEHVVSLPFNSIPGKDDLERAEKLVQQCIETRGVKIKITEVPVPVPYGSAFEGEVVRKKDMRVEFGGKYSRAFEYLRMVPAEQVEDGRVQVIGPSFADVEEGGYLDLGILIEVAGRKMQKDFEPVLERQVHYFVNGASGIQHIGQRDIAWIRISKAAADKGFTLEHFGKILHARFHGEFGAIVDKVQVKVITDPALHAEWLQHARDAYNERNERMGSPDRRACRSSTPAPCARALRRPTSASSARSGWACAARTTGWTARPASRSTRPAPTSRSAWATPSTRSRATGPAPTTWRSRTARARCMKWPCTSIMENPMTACGCFECIVMLVPEANGVMVVSREDTSMTPAGMTFSTLAGMAGGGLQTPGVMGVGKFYLTSPKFISADGGFKRIVWMSSVLKKTMAEEFKAVAEREGDPDLLDKIADETICTDVDGLMAWMEEHEHPALFMDPIF